MTFDELLEKGEGIDPTQWEERCDLAKFAGVTPPTSECQRVLTLARVVFWRLQPSGPQRPQQTITRKASR